MRATALPEPLRPTVFAAGEWPTWNWTAGRLSAKSRLAFATAPSGVAADQYRSVVRRLHAARSGRRLLVTSPGPQDGKSTTASNLSWALTERGHSVLLLELDMRRPSFGSIFPNRPRGAGVEAVLRNEARPDAMIFQVENTRLHVAAVEKPQADAAQLLQGEGLPKLIEWAGRNFDWVVFDAPPVLPVSDTLELTAHADPVLLVVRARSTRAVLVRRAIEALHGSLSCVLLNEGESLLRSYYGYEAYAPIQR